MAPDDAEAAVAETLDANATAVNNFAVGTSKKLVFTYDTGSIVGTVMPRGATVSSPTSKVIVVLVRDTSIPSGYKILTGYPTP
ncbi:RNase A-like domain-containing protein [Rhizobium sp. CNPSo 3464]|uniref:RNase A-like domain-containing protein n=1 Tax=Rhizobium sp. CNPSo 3464 TaxID=3021406 RepID=UPI0033055D05